MVHMKKVTKDSVVNARVPDDLMSRLIAVAQIEDMPVAWVVRKAIRNYIEAAEKESVQNGKRAKA